MLSSFRILELAGEQGAFCGRILADFGADVIKIEPPGGDLSTRVAPFFKDLPDSERSLHWFFLNANKRGITLDIETPTGRELFFRLARTSHAIIESFPVGYMAKLGLDYPALSRLKKDLILTSISPFGQEGPYSQFKGSDLVCMGMGGMQYMCGEPSKPPVYVSFPQAYLCAGAQAAISTLTALYYSQRSGEGQHIDVSVQGVVCADLHTVGPALWDTKKITLRRAGTSRVATSAFIKQRQIWPCQDGYIAFFLAGGKGGARVGGDLAAWMKEMGEAGKTLSQIKWEEFDLNTVDPALYETIQNEISQFFLKHKSIELYEEGSRRGVMIYPVQTVSQIANSPQLAARDFWKNVKHPELDVPITYPGSLARFSDYDAVIRQRAPLIGEHNLDIYEGELGLSREETIALKRANVI